MPVGEQEKLKESASRAKRVDSLSSLFYKTRSLFSRAAPFRIADSSVSTLSSTFLFLTRSPARQIRSSRDELRADCTGTRVTGRGTFLVKYEQLITSSCCRASAPIPLSMIYRYRVSRDPIHILRIGRARRGSRPREYYK